MMYLVDRHPFNAQPNRQRREMADFCDNEMLRLLLTVQDGIDDVSSLVDILREKAKQINRKYPRQKPIKVENRFISDNGGFVVISVGTDEYREHVGTLYFIPVRCITNNAYFNELWERIQQEGGES